MSEKTASFVVCDKVTPVITPIGEVLTPEQWIERYPVANVIKTVVQGGTMNGGFFGIFDQMVESYGQQGCDFSECETDQDYLDAIEAFEDEQNTFTDEPSAEERIASALEYQNLMEY